MTSRSMNVAFVVTALASAILCAPSKVAATTITITPASAIAQVTVVPDNEIQNLGTTAATATDTVGNDTAASTVTSQINPDVNVVTTVNGTNGEATGLATITYYVLATSNTGQAGLPVSVIINAMGGVTQSITTSANGASVNFNGSPIANLTCAKNDCSTGTSFSIATPETLLTGTLYSISIEAQASANTIVGGTFDQQSAFVDPHVTFASGFDADGFQLNFSDGVGNNPDATPLPAAFPLFATGLGGLGLLGWRRKRKAQAVA